MDNVYTLCQGRLKHALIRSGYVKAYDTVWRDGLWLKLWDMRVRRRMNSERIYT